MHWVRSTYLSNKRRKAKFLTIGHSCRLLHIISCCVTVSFNDIVGAFPIKILPPRIVMPTTRRQSSYAAANNTPLAVLKRSKLAREGIRVVSPDVVVRSIVLFDSGDDEANTSTGFVARSNDDYTTPSKKPEARKRKARTQIDVDSPLEDFRKITNATESNQTPQILNSNDTIISTPTKKKRVATAKVTPNSGDASEVKQLKSSSNVINAPQDWLETYNLVKELRQDRTAPCDHSGSEALPDKSKDPIARRFQVLMCLMLSSQTKDAVVGAAIRSMQSDNVLDIDSVHQMDSSTLDRYIQKVGFHNNKTKYIKEAVQILKDKYGGDIPRTASEMIQDLPGIGPKMAYIIESVAWGTQSGIGVDTHMHRLFNVLRWVHNTNTPEKTRLQLESWLPREYWAEVNLLWVGFGQEVQQEKAKILRKALSSSRPKDALQLLKRCGLDYRKVGKELDLMDEIDSVLKQGES